MTAADEQIRKDIAENVAMQAYFKKYSEHQVDSFLGIKRRAGGF